MSTIVKERFVQDPPYARRAERVETQNLIEDPIDGCSAVPLQVNRDGRGALLELLTMRDATIEPIVHVYQVWAEPGSLRGWVYHAWQSDRLAFTNGTLKLTLYDIREESPTFRKLNRLIVGEERKVLLTIPAFVAHCVENLGPAVASFVNMPTRVFYPDDPDKFRLPWNPEHAAELSEVGRGA